MHRNHYPMELWLPISSFRTNMGREAISDEHYVIDLCDEILGQTAEAVSIEFDFLSESDYGTTLPGVDASYICLL